MRAGAWVAAIKMMKMTPAKAAARKVEVARPARVRPLAAQFVPAPLRLRRSTDSAAWRPLRIEDTRRQQWLEPTSDAKFPPEIDLDWMLSRTYRPRQLLAVISPSLGVGLSNLKHRGPGETQGRALGCCCCRRAHSISLPPSYLPPVPWSNIDGGGLNPARLWGFRLPNPSI